jgi:PilZ domain
MVQGYIFGKPSPAEVARELANSVTVEAEGFACTREPRHRLMRRAMAAIGGETVELKLRNISSMGASVECRLPVAPGQALTIDIVGVGPVRGVVRWAQAGKFGIQFEGQFDLGRLAPKKETRNAATMMRPTYMDQQREAS